MVDSTDPNITEQVLAELRLCARLWDAVRQNLAYWEMAKFTGKPSRQAPAFLFDNWHTLNYRHRVSALLFIERCNPGLFDALFAYLGKAPGRWTGRMVKICMADLREGEGECSPAPPSRSHSGG